MIRFLFTCCICLVSFSITTISYAQTIENNLQHLLDSVYLAHDSAVGIMIHVEAPDKNITWTSASGYGNKSTKGELNPLQPTLIASNTKTFVATAILKLVENGQIGLDEPIAKLIHKNTFHMLQGDGYDLDHITVKHLLSHTSGIADYVNDAYFEFVNNNPQHKWKRSEQIQRTVEVGNPLYKPGSDYTYGDINYLLLTEIIEQKTDQPFYRAIRDLLSFKKHGIHHTWFIDLEEKPESALALAHQYWNKYDWDSYALNPSWDLYGGGGLASTTKDLAQFFNLLFNGQIIKDQVLLKTMHTFVLPKKQSVYCLGLLKISFHGMEAWYHGGFWGTDVMYIPELNLTISAFTLQKDKRKLNALISKNIVDLIKQY